MSLEIKRLHTERDGKIELGGGNPYAHKTEIPCPVGAIRRFSAISKGLNPVLRNFHLEVAVQRGGP